jgi:hypothetical protein
MLHHYSSRMINNMWLYADGRHVEVEFLNAYLVSSLPLTSFSDAKDRENENNELRLPARQSAAQRSHCLVPAEASVH